MRAAATGATLSTCSGRDAKFALDLDAEGVEHVRRLAESLGTGLPAENFRVGAIERMPFAMDSPMW